MRILIFTNYGYHYYQMKKKNILFMAIGIKLFQN